jgi:RecJ-like exonuclease
MKQIRHLSFEDWLEKHGLRGGIVQCPRCQGEGTVSNPYTQVEIECGECNGTGSYNTLKPKYEEETEADRKRLEDFYGEKVEFIE